MAISAALAATPTPDRPYLSRTGFLVTADTLEMELGVRAAESGSVPATLKYAFGSVAEVRLQSNLGGFGQEASPQLLAGAKFRLIPQKRQALALWVASGIPVGAGETWRGELHALFATVVGGKGSRWRLRLNGGVDLAAMGDGGVGFDGAPLQVALTFKPASRLRVFGELAGRAGAPECGQGADCAYGRVSVNGGALVKLTEHLGIDAAGGYQFFNDGQFFVTAGMTANFGKFE